MRKRSKLEAIKFDELFTVQSFLAGFSVKVIQGYIADKGLAGWRKLTECEDSWQVTDLLQPYISPDSSD